MSFHRSDALFATNSRTSEFIPKCMNRPKFEDASIELADRASTLEGALRLRINPDTDAERWPSSIRMTFPYER